jgi:hypothetical protein
VRSADDAAGDFAAVGDQDLGECFGEHGGGCRGWCGGQKGVRIGGAGLI